MPGVCPLQKTDAPCLSIREDRCMPCYVYRGWTICQFRHEGRDSGYDIQQHCRVTETEVRTAPPGFAIKVAYELKPHDRLAVIMTKVFLKDETVVYNDKTEGKLYVR